jgi:enamine deaminase RidA (YjgF/YER057c/UK114 family)
VSSAQSRSSSTPRAPSAERINVGLRRRPAGRRFPHHESQRDAHLRLRQLLVADPLSAPVGPYSPWRRAGDLVVISGQLGLQPRHRHRPSPRVGAGTARAGPDQRSSRLGRSRGHVRTGL